MATDNPLNDNFRQFRMEYDEYLNEKYVAKENGKGLSTNDFTDADKSKLDKITISGGTATVDTSQFATKTDLANSIASITVGSGSAYSLPVATSTKLGGIKVGDGLIIDSTTGKLSVAETAAYSLPTATSNKLGGVKIGTGVSLDSNDRLTLTPATKSKIGGFIVGDGLAMDSETNKLNVTLDTSQFATKSEIATVYKVKGSVSKFSDLPTDAEIGDVYNIRQAGGSDIYGKEISAGDNVVKISNGWDNLGGVFDTSQFATTVLASPTISGLMSNSDKAKLDSLALITDIGDNITLSGGTIKAGGGVVNGNLYLQANSGKGGTISGAGANADNGYNGGVIHLYGGNGVGSGGAGGQIDLSGGKGTIFGGDGGKIDLSGGKGSSVDGSGGVIDLSPDGSIKGNVVFTGTPTFMKGANGLALVDSGTVDVSNFVTKSELANSIASMTVSSDSAYSLPAATTTKLGGIKIGDGVSIDDNSKLNLDTATSTKLGGIKVGGGLIIDSTTGKLSVAETAAYSLPTATSNKLGGVKIGVGVSLDSNDRLTLTPATASKIGGFKVGKGLAMDDDTLSATFDGYKSGESITISGSETTNSGKIYASGGDRSTNGGNGGEIFLNGGKGVGTGGKGGSIDLSGGKGTVNGGNGGEIDLSGGSGDSLGGDAGKIILTGGGTGSSKGNGGTIDMSPNGSIKGDIVFTGTPTFMKGANGLALVDSGTVDVSNFVTKSELANSIASMTVSSDSAYSLPAATSTKLGGIKVGDGLAMDGETLKANISNASTTTAGLMSKDDKIKLDKFSFLETQETKDDGTVTKYVVPNYYDIYLFCGSLAVHDVKNNNWHAAYVEQSWLNEALNYLTNGQYTSYDEDATYPVTDAEILKYCIDKGYIDSSRINLEEAEIVKLINIYCRSVQMGKFLVSHEVVYDSETNTVDRHQLAIAVDTDEDGTSDFMFVIPGDLESRLTNIESDAASLDSRVDSLEAVDVKTADFGKIRINFSDFNKLMANFATVSAG